MKKNKFLLIFCLFVGPQWVGLSSHALSEVEVSGELNVSLAAWNLPTGKRGNSAFEVPTLFLDINSPLKQDNLLVLRVEGSEEKTGTVDRFSLKMREAYLDLVSVFPGLRALRVGLIPQVWQEAQYEQTSDRYLGRTAWALTEKWNYLSPSDLGVSYMSQLPWNGGEYALGFANGQGTQEKENGPHKEFSLFMRFTGLGPWGLNLNYVRGSYENYDEENGLKERVQMLLTYQVENFQVGLEGLLTQDPADAFAVYHIGDGVDVTDLGGQVVRGFGASLFTAFKTGSRGELLLRYDYLNPAQGESGRDLKTALVAWSYEVSEDVRAAIMTDYTWYGENFAPGYRDQSKLALATQVLF